MPTQQEKEVYALIHALETDVARLLIDTLPDQPNPLALNETNQACKRFYKANPTKTSVEPRWQELFVYASYPVKLSVWLNNVEVLSQHLTIKAESLKEFHGALSKLKEARNGACHTGLLTDEDHNLTRMEGSWIFTDYPDIDLQEFRREWKLVRDPSHVAGVVIPDYEREERTIPNNLPGHEYDNIGFVGRADDIEKLKNNLRGIRPVICVTAAGGVGKTALVLECLRGIVKGDSSFGFERVHWISLKTERFDSGELIRIHDALRNPSEIIESLQSQLAETVGAPQKIGEGADKNSDSAEPMSLEVSHQQVIQGATDNLLEILRTRRILLVIDNIETIDWRQKQISELLGLNHGNSKILVTSRLSLNQAELPYYLQEMKKADAVLLMRKSLESLNVEERRSDAELEVFCDKLFCNPLAIRWFALSRASDEATADLLKEGGKLDEIRKFCFDTAYYSLEFSHQRYLKVFVAINRPLSQVQIALLLNNYDIDQVYLDLKHLARSSFVRLSNDEYGSGGDSWVMSQAAREFLLTQKDPEDLDHHRRLQAKNQKLIEQRDSARTNFLNSGQFAAQSFNPKTTDEALIVSILTSAVGALDAADKNNNADSQAQHINSAVENIEKAESLLPGYCDVWRVSAQVQVALSSNEQAVENFEKALQLAGDCQEPILFHYAKYALKEDVPRALKILSVLGPDAAPQLLDLLAQARFQSGQFQEAAATFERLWAHRETSNHVSFQVASRYLKCLLELVKLSQDDKSKLGFIQRAFQVTIEALDNPLAPKPDFREAVQRHVQEACALMARQETSEPHPPSWDYFEPLFGTLKKRIRNLIGAQAEGVGLLKRAYPKLSSTLDEILLPLRETGYGYVEKIILSSGNFKKEGFISSTDGGRYYFNQGDLSTDSGAKVNPKAWIEFCRRTYDETLHVNFAPAPASKNGGLPRATYVRINESVTTPSTETTQSANPATDADENAPVAETRVLSRPAQLAAQQKQERKQENQRRKQEQKEHKQKEQALQQLEEERQRTQEEARKQEDREQQRREEVQRQAQEAQLKREKQEQRERQVAQRQLEAGTPMEGIVVPFDAGKNFTRIESPDNPDLKYMLSRKDFEGISWAELQMLERPRVRFVLLADGKQARQARLVEEEREA